MGPGFRDRHLSEQYLISLFCFLTDFFEPESYVSEKSKWRSAAIAYSLLSRTYGSMAYPHLQDIEVLALSSWLKACSKSPSMTWLRMMLSEGRY